MNAKPNVTKSKNELLREAFQGAMTTKEKQFAVKREWVNGLDSAAIAEGGMVPLTIKDILPPLEMGLIFDKVGIPVETGVVGDISWPIMGSVEAKIVGEKEIPDDFSHELSLAVVSASGLVVISPCSHKGALNIINGCMETVGCSNLLAFVGGLHFVDGDACEREATSFARDFERLYPGACLYTGHCTCDRAKEVLAANMANVRFFSTGMVIEL
jgi:metal-dependent hydrolase (beta-lactamase superfamily II)